MVRGLYLDTTQHLLHFIYSRPRRMSIYGRLKIIGEEGQDSPYVEHGPRRTHCRWDHLVCVFYVCRCLSTTNGDCTALVFIIAAAAPSGWSGSYRHTVEGSQHHLVCQPTSPGIDARVYQTDYFRTRTCHFYQQQPTANPLRAEGAVEVAYRTMCYDIQS
jgi:hypothetical protein